MAYFSLELLLICLNLIRIELSIIHMAVVLLSLFLDHSLALSLKWVLYISLLFNSILPQEHK